MSGETLTITAPRRMTVLGRPVRTYSVGRYYDPATGQFISVDPAVDKTGQPYAYVNGDPVDLTDPLGFGCFSSFTSFGNCVTDAATAAYSRASNLINSGLCYIGQAAVSAWNNPRQLGIQAAIVVIGIGTDGAAIPVLEELDALAASGEALDAADAGGLLTRAGRAFAKHSRLFSPITGGPAALNEAGQSALEEILTNPSTTIGIMRGGNFAGGAVFIGPDGIGAVFGPDGTFQYFGRFP